MNNCKIFIITRTGKKENYDSNSLTFLENRNDIQFLEIKNYKEKKLTLNQNIEVIKIYNSLLEDFNFVNKNIRIIEIIKTKIEKIPNLSEYENLEELTIKDSYIKKIDYPFPINLRNLNLEYNQIDDTFFNNLDFFPLELININIGHNYITKIPPIIIRNKVNYNNNSIEEKKIFTIFLDDNIISDINKPLIDIQSIRLNMFENTQTVHRQSINIKSIGLNMFENKQTVHIQSINDSVSKSIKKILELTKNIEEYYNNNYIGEILYEFYGVYIFRIFIYSYNIRQIEKMIKDKSIHSKMHITYNNLLVRVWQIIKNHPEKNNLIERLKNEIHDSFTYCFTGRINRLVNTLSGFVEGIKVTISEKEEVQNEIAIIIRNFGEKNISKENALKKINEVFNGRNLDEKYKKSWIDALEDY
jgi:hypothetical protein